MNNLISIGKAAKQLNVSIDSLRRWDKNNRLKAIRVGPRGRRYYRQSDIDLFLRDLLALAEQWVKREIGYAPERDVYCQTRDDFQARLETLQSTLKNKVSLSAISLLSAVAGEIGNNSFDHNLGNWPDIPGIFFSKRSQLPKPISRRGLKALWPTNLASATKRENKKPQPLPQVWDMRKITLTFRLRRGKKNGKEEKRNRGRK